MNGIVALVRTNITRLQRATLEALVVLDVHARDVIKGDLIDKGVNEATDFAWQSQLRYYWEKEDLWVRIINSTLSYNYEYLGNTARLVITPLTDRCYRTLCGAIYLNYGGAPEGPAGTGKTETVKDLSKALARQCIVFNCSDGLTYQQMGKFFKGLASCGAWSCFDEFNRIDLEVLSVVAQQLHSIQVAVERKVHEFDFEGQIIPIKWSCNCFITMNPGYAGRSELPDNLKALFRSVAMMVPNYGMIAEISLYSFGFMTAGPLSQKVVTTYKLCSEQLSSQDHYDYGMRAVKSVLTAAGNLKRKYIEEDEQVLLLRAINDVNLAKFLAHDLPLFKNITSDLFPGVVLPRPDYDALMVCVNAQLKKYNLQGEEYFVDKIIQLYEMIVVRHGLMVVGDPFSGKTSAMNVLAGALSNLAEKGLMDEMKTHIKIVNPKSISMGQLYGYVDPVSNDWSDGVLAVWYRYMASNMDIKDRRWLVFDGPVDAIWIENMNTVLDDNRKLCLMSGEIIQMSANMNMIFEPMDLAAASPATVSRCGMVYLQPHMMGWRPLYKSWKNTLPALFLDDRYCEFYLPLFDELIDVVVQPCINYIRNECHETTPTNDQNIIQSILRLWKSLIKVFTEDEKYSSEDGSAAIDKKEVMKIVDSSFVFACCWSLCVTINSQYRRPFDIFFKKVCNGEIDGLQKFNNRRILPSAMDKGTIYDYVYNSTTNEWKSWVSLVDQEQIDKFPKDIQPQDIVVTTIDTIRYSYIQEHCIMNNIPTLFVGPTGTGKSVYINSVLLDRLSKDKFNIIQVGFSAQTGANQVQNIIDQKSDKRRTGIFGPKNIGMRAVVFIDDLNMPVKEKYGAQPPIEILRQFMDQGGWYDLKDNKHPFRQFVDTMCIAAMGPPGGGKSFITPRFQRHFNVVAFAFFEENVMKTIFSTILKWYFRTGNFAQDVFMLEGKLVLATLQIYRQIQEDLKPTPLKSHYTFNLRDVSKVICGICLSTKREVPNSDVAVRLWAHEITRVFGDRLTNDEDRTWMMEAVKEAIRAPFASNFDLLFKSLDTDKNGKVESLDEWRGLAFGDIMTAYGLTDRPYEEIEDRQKLFQCADEALAQYNAVSDKPMDLVLFGFAVEHLLRVGRILKQPGGHALLVGVGGSGRQSLTRLASKIADFEIFQIEIKKNYRMIEFREDLKELMRSCGGKGNPTVFIFTDNSIKEEAFLEDVNNILNTGEVPNIFPPDEKAEVQDSVRKAAKEEEKCPEGTPQQLFGYFVERCRANLHIVLCFSPIGDSFRNRVRNFPSLVNCTTIDWFSEWPKDALQSVAVRFLGEIEMEEETRQSCVEMVQTFHSDTVDSARLFLRELKRNYYVTPTSYLELISTFKSLLAEKRLEVKTGRDKYLNGYDCLIATEESVGKMQLTLEAKQPMLIEKSKEVEIQAVEVEKQAVAAEKIAAVVAVEEAEAKLMADDANEIKMDCEAALSEAMPALKAAEEALKAITKQDITLIKSVKVAPAAVEMVLTGVMILLEEKPESKMDPATGQRRQEWWKLSCQIMNRGSFLNDLLQYDKEGIKESIIKQLAPYLADPRFTKEAMVPINPIAANMAAWVIAMDSYYRVNLIVKPKQEQLTIAMAKFQEVDGVLKVKQASLREVQAKVAKLKKSLQDTMDEKAQLEADVYDCEQKLIRATKLIDGLGSQKTLWKETSLKLGDVYINLTGDVLISSGMIAYLGAFNSVFRDDLAAKWVQSCFDKQIPNSGAFSLSRVLGDGVQIRNWGLQGLPSDAFSVENAIIQQKTRRWPLFIDPQGQANKWLRTMGKEQNIKIMKFTEGTYLKFLEACIRQGTPVLIENVAEELDPAIEPLLQKQIVKKGTSMTIKIGDSIIEYDKNFKFFMTTKLRNPHYLPEVSTKVTLLNFMITYEGLTDQLLAIIVAKEQPDLEIKKEEIVLENAKSKNKLTETENQILTVLKESSDILGDASAIEILGAASVLTAEIEKKQEQAKITEADIDVQRIGYKPIALRTAGLFFCIQVLANIDPMYQYSLPFFQNLFIQAIIDAPAAEELEERTNSLNAEFLAMLYRNICRSLFEKDKLIFSFLLCVKLQEMSKEVDMVEFRFLLTGGVSLGETLPDPPAPWIIEKAWQELNRACMMPGFKGFMDHFCSNISKYKEFNESDEPHLWEFPAEANKILSNLRKLIIMRCLRPDKLVPSVAKYVVDSLGESFLNPPPFDLPTIFRDSDNKIPLIFILSPGADPLNGLMKFAEAKKKSESIKTVSLGQGQGVKAEAAIREAQKAGNWVVLQNCHLAISWMGTLEKLCEDMGSSNTNHRDFRLWLTSYPASTFPVAVLQNGVKMTNEAPKGLRANVSNSFLIDPISNPVFFGGTSAPKKFRKLLFGLCFFHAVIQERRLYGPLGWNIQYGFNETDLRISVQQLSIFVDENPDKVPISALRYLIGECNYGGRVTEELDRRTLMVLMGEYFNESMYDDDYRFSPSGIYYAPKHGDYESYIKYAQSLPPFPKPEIFGFHENAAITKNINDSENMLMTVLSTQGAAAGGGDDDQDAIVNQLADSILREVPEPFDVHAAEVKFPVSYTQSMNTVLTQELIRFNGLIVIIRSSLKDIKRAIKGEVLLSADLESALFYMIDGKVPVLWMQQSYPSLKPLAGYVRDLKERIDFFQHWADTEIPQYFWINKFYFTHGFLTGALQNYARLYKIAIDTMDLDFEVIHDVIDIESLKGPSEGIHVYGMWIEGCRWDDQTRCLGESEEKVLYTRCPMMWFKPVKKVDKNFEAIYETPLYKTSERRGVLATTGHSSNFCLRVHLPSDQPQSHWIKRGVAMICTLND